MLFRRCFTAVVVVAVFSVDDAISKWIRGFLDQEWGNKVPPFLNENPQNKNADETVWVFCTASANSDDTKHTYAVTHSQALSVFPSVRATVWRSDGHSVFLAISLMPKILYIFYFHQTKNQILKQTKRMLRSQQIYSGKNVADCRMTKPKRPILFDWGTKQITI